MVQSKIQEGELLKSHLAQERVEKERLQQQEKDFELQLQSLKQQYSNISISLAQGESYSCEKCGHIQCVPGTHNTALVAQGEHIQKEEERIQ